jgi:hypothetical protein
MRKTIERRMTPMARKVGKFSSEALSVGRRLAHLCEEIQRLEMERDAFERQAHLMLKTWTPPQGRSPEELWPAVPNGEAVANFESGERLRKQLGLTESDILQGREPPPGCDPVDPGEGDICDYLADIGERAGYHHGSTEDPRD